MNKPSMLEELGTSSRNVGRALVGQGLGMGWGDEAEAWLRSRIGQGSYEDNLRKIRQEYAKYAEEESPFAAGAMEFTGGALPGVAAAMTGFGVPALTRLPLTARLVGGGATAGGLSGAGSALEDQRVEQGLGGAGLGALVGGVLPLVPRAGGAVMNWAGERLFPTEATAGRRAAAQMSRALGESGIAPQDLPQLVQGAQAGRVPAVVANVDPGLLDLAETVAQRTGSGARRVERELLGQKAGARERVQQQVQQGLQPGDFYADEQALSDALRAKAGPMYDKAYAHGAVDDPLINTILTNPTFQAAYKRGQAIANTEAMAARLRGEDPTPYKLPEIYDAPQEIGRDPLTNAPIFGEPKLRQVPNVRALDYVKRGLDDMIDAGFRGEAAVGRTQATALKQLRNQFRERLKQMVPEYGEALREYAGDMEVRDAMRAGMDDFAKLDHEQIERMVKDFTNAEKQAFRTGVARNLYSRIMDPSIDFNAAQRVIGSPEMRKKLQPLFTNPGQYKLFESALQREAQLFREANRVLSGSQTGKRMQMREQFEEGDGQSLTNAVGSAISGGGFLSSLSQMAMNYLGSSALNEKTASKLADMLMSKDPNDVAAVVRFLEEEAARRAPREAAASATEAGLTTGALSSFWPTTEE